MSWFDDWGNNLKAAFGGGLLATPLSDFGKWVGDSIDSWTGKASVDAARDANAMNLDLANTAVQRRAKDMQAAGINPLLAAGSPAGGSVQSTGGNSAGNPVGAVVGLLKGVVDIQKTIADSGLVQLQQGKVSADTTAQNLANAFAEKANPLNLSSMELQNNFDNAANPVKLKMLASSLEGVDLENVNKALDAKAIEAGIDLTKVQKDLAFYNMVEQRFRAGGLDVGNNIENVPMLVELAAKVVALKTAGIELKNLEAFNEALPPGSSKFVDILKNVLGLFKK